MNMGSLSRFVLSHKLLVGIVWILVTVVAFFSVGPAASSLSQEFGIPDQESTEVNRAVTERYGVNGSASPVVAVVTLPEGTTVDTSGVQEELGRVFGQASEAAPSARLVSFASTGDRLFVSDDGRTTFALVYTPSEAPQEPSPELDAVKEALGEATVAGAPVLLTGLIELETGGGGDEEGDGGVLNETLIGGLGALLVLLWVYGSFLALLPIVMAAVSILTTFLAIWGVTAFADVSVVVQFLIALIGLGVAIDYSLLIVTRWREERAAGLDNTAAVQKAMETAGHAVVFSGTTVAIGLLALVALPVPFLRSIGYGGMLIPLVSVVVAITLLPILLATVGPRLDWPRLRRGDQHSRAWERWTRFAVRNHWLAAGVALLILLALTIPAFTLRVGYPDPDSLASSGEAHDALTALKDSGIGKGALTPFVVLVEGGDPEAAATTLDEVEGVLGTVAPADEGWQQTNDALVVALPAMDGNSAAGAATLDRVRDAADGLAGEVRVGGATAFQADFIDAVYANFPLMVALVVLITFVLLVRAFRSILLPLKAVVLNVLSVGAAYGVLVLVWQEGFGSGAIWGIEPTGAITNWLPIAVFAFLFGLSMDYEVFILARIREEYDRTGSTDQAVIRGMGQTGRLVTAAAIILVLAFVALSATPETTIKVFATGLAAGILIDATIIRALLVPATVSLMGRWNWWLPGWLDRFMPQPTPVPVPIRPSPIEE